jgi:hypothetical protein
LTDPENDSAAPSPSAAYWDRLVEVTPTSANDGLKHAAAARGTRAARDMKVRTEIAAGWPDGWTYFDAVLYAMEQNTLVMMKRSNETTDSYTPVRESLLLLQSAATVTVHEIRHLLLGGFWAGAAARWRALHELAVCGTLLAKHGNEIAERFLAHSFVVQTKRLRDFYAVHGRGPVPKEELDRRWSDAEAMVAEHETPDDPVRFTTQYAWALPLLKLSASGRRPRPTFGALERLANLQDLRLLVAGSHGLVHNDSAGLASYVIERDGYVLSPIASHTATVARPTLISLTRMVPATHLCFEPELNDFSKVLGLLGTALCENANRGIRAFV